MKSIHFTILSLFLFSCTQDIPNFSVKNTYRSIEKQLSFGPRNPGSKGHRKIYHWLIAELQEKAETVKTQTFTWYDERFDKQYKLNNIIASFNNNAMQRILLAAHYDTNPYAEKDPDSLRQKKPILGANDGAAAVAILLEIAQILKTNRLGIGIDLVFFDGEDLGDEAHPKNYCIGSKEFAKKIKNYHPRKAILLDLVGGKDLKIQYEANSLRYAPTVLEEVFDIAHKLGYEKIFVKEKAAALMDDHVPLIEKGIPMIDLVDQELVVENKNGIHHTHRDILENIDIMSLEIIGNVIVHVIYGE